MRSRIEALIAWCANRLLFFELWWKALPARDAGRLLTAAGPFRYWLERQRQLPPHTLSEPEERIINLKNATGSAALKTLYGAIANRQVFRVRVDGEEKELNRGEAINLMRHPDPDGRAATHREQMRVFERDSGLLGPIYLSLARDWRSEDIDLRGYASPISVRNLVMVLRLLAVEGLGRVWRIVERVRDSELTGNANIIRNAVNRLVERGLLADCDQHGKPVTWAYKAGGTRRLVQLIQTGRQWCQAAFRWEPVESKIAAAARRHKSVSHGGAVLEAVQLLSAAGHDVDDHLQALLADDAAPWRGAGSGVQPERRMVVD